VAERVATRPRRDGSKQIRHLARDTERGEHGRRGLTMVAAIEDGMHFAVAILLLVAAAAMLVHTVEDFVTSEAEFAQRTTSAINSVLFVIIVMEILRTVVAHFDDAGLQLKPFLIIGIISAVRHILTVGAKVSLGAAASGSEFRKTQIELGVNAAVVLALVVGLILIRRTDHR
jgi:uncharacterized membrane protein (DUF373 family)